jgi:hypothetical protein
MGGNLRQKRETIKETLLEERPPIPKIKTTTKQNKPSNVQMKQYNTLKVQ